MVARPFAGLKSECDLVAMSVLVPAATTSIPLANGEDVMLAATVLPMAWPALHRADDKTIVGLQVTGGSGDISRDVAAAYLAATDLAPGTPVLTVGRPGDGPRLQDLVKVTAELDVTVHEGFDYWLEGAAADLSEDLKAGLERANEQVVPTQRLVGVDAAYWCRIGTKEHLRWVLPESEDALLDAFARLSARDQLGLGPGTKYVGSFRAQGLLAAVWDLAPGDEAADVTESAVEFRGRLTEALGETGELTSQLRRIRDGLTGRQITIR